jgi:hypothetical protein
MVLEGTGDDLGGGGGAAVDQDGHRQAAGDVAGSGAQALAFGAAADTGVGYGAGFEEEVCDASGLVEEAAGIVAQVEHDAAGAGSDVGEQALDSLADVGGGALVEEGQADVGDVVFAPGDHDARIDQRAAQDDVAGLSAVGHDRDADLGADVAAQALDDLGQGHVLQRHAVGVGDDVARHEPGAGGRGVVDGGDDDGAAFALGDLDAEAAELAAGLLLHLARLLAVEALGVLVEGAEHPADGGLDEGGLVGGVDVLGPDAVDDLAEQG